ncbi:MAG: hypothetical protein WA867_25405 [Candidatus Acidiferrales bacterium]
MPHSDDACGASQEFDWEIRFYRCLLLPHTELSDRATEAAAILSERVSQSVSGVTSAAEQEALDDAHEHLRKIQVLQLGFPEIAGEFVKDHSLVSRNNQIDQPSRDTTGGRTPLSERRHLWKSPAA